jgi:ribonuclease Z
MRNVFVTCVCVALLSLTSPAATQSPQQFRVVLLGTGTPQPLMTRFGPSILVEAGGEPLLIGGGRGALQRLGQIGISDVNRLFLTHLHSDHVVRIPDLYLTGWLIRQRQVRFTVRESRGGDLDTLLAAVRDSESHQVEIGQQSWTRDVPGQIEGA